MKRPSLAIACAMLCLPCALGKADVITEWNSLLLDAIRNESTSPPLAARNLAIVQTAVYEAVNSIEHGYAAYRGSAPAPDGASAEAAAVRAAYDCLTELYPSQWAVFASAYERYTSATPATQAREDGFWVGEWAAYDLLDWRSSDGSSTTVPYIPSSEPGQWRRTPPFFRPPELPQWPYVAPFAITNTTQFSPPGPPALTSTQYTRDFNLTKTLGALNSPNRTAEQTLVARFWSDFSYTVTPPGHWNQIAQNVATNRNNGLGENARLFALLNLAMADAGIIAWDAKYLHNSWRPITAIQQADTDNNPDTEKNEEWVPLLNTPPFPEYISGHSIFSAAAASVLGQFYGTDHVTFTVGSDTLTTTFRTYDSFQEAAEEIGMSRIYGGIHFLSADLDGLAAGRQLGQYVFARFLNPVDVPAVITMHGNAGGSLQIEVVGFAGKSYRLETSTDLLQWQPMLTNTAPFGLEVINQGVSGAHFYRAVKSD